MGGTSSHTIRERRIRANMSNLHAAMVKSVNNTRIVLAGGLIGMDDEAAGGNLNIRRRMVHLSEWLEDIRVISTDSDFDNSFMSPIKKAAEFLSYLRRKDIPTSMDIDGLVFSVSSPYYDEVVNTELSTVSAIFPCIQSAMHIRVKDRNVTLGWKTFKNVQPIPLINRMNPTKLEIVGLDKRLVITNLNFLKCPLSCMYNFERSLAMENFCEVGSANTDKPKLGAPLVVCGRVKSIGPRHITVSGCDTAESIMTVSTSPELSREFERRQLGMLKGAWIRMLITVWYHGDGDDEKDRMRHQAHMLERTSKEQAVADEIIGHARVFGSSSIDKLEREYGPIPEHLPLEVTRGKASLPSHPAYFENEACTKFMDITADIRAARFKTGHHDIHCKPDDVLDDRLTKKYLLAKMGKYGDMRLMLIMIIRYSEMHKPLTKKELRDLLGTCDKFSYYLWLLEHRFVQRNKDGKLVATRAGIEGILESMRSSLERIIKPSTTVFLPDVDVSISGSLAIKYFEKHDSYSPISVDGHSCVIAWVRQDASDEDRDVWRHKVDRIMNDILDVFFLSYHSITAEDISSKVTNNGSKIPASYVNAVLSTLERMGRVNRDGDSWCVSMRDKIERVIAKSDEALSKKEIMRSSFVAGVYKYEADDVLEALAKDGVVHKSSDGKWISKEKLDRWEERIAYEEIKKVAITLLGRRHSGMDKDMFIGRLRYSIHSIVRGSNQSEQLKRVVRQLENDNFIEQNDGMYRLGTRR